MIHNDPNPNQVNNSIYTIAKIKNNIPSLSPEELVFLGDEGVEISENTDLTKIGVRLVPYQEGSPHNGKPIDVSLSTLQPWPTLLEPFLRFDLAKSGVMHLETNFETLSVLVEFFKRWIPSDTENQEAFTRLNNYLNQSRLEKADEKEKELNDAYYDQQSPPSCDIRFPNTIIKGSDEEQHDSITHPFDKALQLYLVANYLNVKEVTDFSIKFIQSKDFLETIDNEAYRDLFQRLEGMLAPDEFHFTWDVLFIKACQTKRYDDAKFLLEFYLKKNDLEDLRGWVKKPNLPEEMLPLLIKMVLNVDDKNTLDFDERFNFAIQLLQDHFGQIFDSHESSLTNTSFFYSLFSIEEAVQTLEQGSRLLGFFVTNPSETLNPSPALSHEEKNFLNANGVFASSFNFRESIVSIILFQKMLHSFTKRDKHGDILPLLKILCRQIQLREKDASMKGLEGKILLTIRTCFLTLFKQSSSCEQYLKNLEFFMATRDRVGEWLPSFAETDRSLFDLEATQFTEFNPLKIHTLKSEDILRIIALAEKIKAANPSDLILLQSILRAIRRYRNTNLNEIKSKFSKEISALYQLVGIIDTPISQNIFGLIAQGQEEDAVRLFNRMENAIEIFNSGCLETLSIDQIMSFTQRLESTTRAGIFSSMSKFLLEKKRWGDFFNFQEKTLHSLPQLNREMTIHYLTASLKDYKKTNIELCLKASEFLVNSLKSFHFNNIASERNMISELLTLAKIFMKSKNQNLLEVVKNFSTLIEEKIFKKPQLIKIQHSALAARLLLGEGREVIDELHGVKAKCSCLDRLGEVVSLIKSSSLPVESARALCAFAFDPRVLEEMNKNPRDSMDKLYPFLLRVCSRLSYIYKMEGHTELHKEMDRYINTILSLNIPHFSSGVAEFFNLSGDVSFLLTFKSTATPKEFNILLSKTGKLLARMKNEQLFQELAQKCSYGDFKILSDAYFSTLRKISGSEESQNPTSCPSNFYNALLMCHAFPLQGVLSRQGKRKRELQVSPLEEEGREKIREEEGKEKVLEEPLLKKGRMETSEKPGNQA